MKGGKYKTHLMKKVYQNYFQQKQAKLSRYVRLDKNKIQLFSGYKTYLKYKDTQSFHQKICHANTNQKKTSVAILTPAKQILRQITLLQIEEHYKIIKCSINQKAITILNSYTPKKVA